MCRILILCSYFVIEIPLTVSGGNARDLAREKNMKRQVELQKRKCANSKGSNKGMSLEQRKQRYSILC